ncbi:MAG: patatin-like phospholipase family protein [Alphaproteobacteria bacterium]
MMNRQAYKALCFLSVLFLCTHSTRASQEDPREQSLKKFQTISCLKSNLVHSYRAEKQKEEAPIEEKAPLRILSCDGGGIRGILELMFLAALEKKADKPCYQMFDVMAGTSTGGMIALALSIGIPAHEILDLYIKRGDEIFVKNKSIRGPKYNSEMRKKIFFEFFKDKKLSDAKCPVLVTAYGIERGKSFRLCSKYPQTKLRSKEYDMLMGDAALATSAAPTFFTPEKIEAVEGIFGTEGKRTVLNLIDGGVFANNPSIKAYSYAKALFPERFKAHTPYMLSLGTGYKDFSIPIEDAEKYGLLKWALKLLPILLEGPSDSNDQDMAILLEDNYDRVTIHLEHAEAAMDKGGENIKRLLQDGNAMLRENATILEKWAKYCSR